MAFRRFFSETPLLLVIVLTLLVTGCHSKKRSEEVKNYAYQEGSGASGDSAYRLPSKPWVEEGLECYGLVVGIDDYGRMLTGLPIKAKVLTIRPDSVRMKALETVSLAHVKGCKKLGLTRGDIWWEVEGDLFKTREEATAWLKERGLLMGQESAPRPVAKD